MPDKKWIVDLDLDRNELQNAVIQNLGTAPQNPKAGQIWYDTSTNLIYFYDGTAAKAVGYLPIASSNTLGGVKIGTNVNVASDGTISINDASTSNKGVIEIATDSEASTGTDEVRAINAKQLATKVAKNADIVGATKCKITYDNKGLVTAGADLSASDIPDISATYVTTARIGAANGVAELDSTGKVPSSQLPSYVDDVIELLTMASAAPATCEQGDKYYNTTSHKIFTATATNTWGSTGTDPVKDAIYITLDDDNTWRWSGSTMVNLGGPVGAATETNPGIAELATQAEVNTGTDDERIVTPLKLATYVSGMAKKITAINGALTASNGVCTWSITNTLNTPDVIVRVYEIVSGEEVIPAVVATSSTVTIKINSTSTIAASTYKAVIIG